MADARMAGRTPLPRLLLLEPQNLLRRTVSAVAKQMSLMEISEAASVESAQRLLDSDQFDAMVVALDDQGLAAAMIERVRRGSFRTNSSVPVIVMTEMCDERRIAQMKAMKVRRILLKPFKVKGVLESITDLCAA